MPSTMFLPMPEKHPLILLITLSPSFLKFPQTFTDLAFLFLHYHVTLLYHIQYLQVVMSEHPLIQKQLLFFFTRIIVKEKVEGPLKMTERAVILPPPHNTMAPLPIPPPSSNSKPCLCSRRGPITGKLFPGFPTYRFMIGLIRMLVFSANQPEWGGGSRDYPSQELMAGEDWAPSACSPLCQTKLLFLCKMGGLAGRVWFWSELHFYLAPKSKYLDLIKKWDEVSQTHGALFYEPHPISFYITI